MKPDFEYLRRLKTLISNIKRNFPQIEIRTNYDLIDGFCLLYVNNKELDVVLDFPNAKALLLCLNWLYYANFSSGALVHCKRDKENLIKRNREKFLYLLRYGESWEKIQGKKFGDMWELFLKRYAKAKKRPDSSEELEQVAEDLEE
jgi:hypothetical protein